jgi:hypothetical protein
LAGRKIFSGIYGTPMNMRRNDVRELRAGGAARKERGRTSALDAIKRARHELFEK